MSGPTLDEETSDVEPVPLQLNRPFAFVALTLLTLGIYPLVRFWKAGHAYALLVSDSGPPGQRFNRLGALALGEVLLAPVLLPTVSWWSLGAAALVRFTLGHLLLEEALRLRDRAAAVHELRFDAAPHAFQLALSGAAFWAPVALLLRPRGVERAEWGLLVRGLTLLLAAAAAACFFRDHNRFGRALLARPDLD